MLYDSARRCPEAVRVPIELMRVQIEVVSVPLEAVNRDRAVV